MSFISSWFKSFKGRIFMISAVPTLLVSAVGLYSVFGMQSIANRLKEGTSSKIERSQIFNELVNLSGYSASAFWVSKSADEASTRANEVALMEKTLKDLKDHFDEFSKTSHDPSIDREMKPMIEGFPKFAENYQKAIDLLKASSADKDKESLELYKSQISPFVFLVKDTSIKINSMQLDLYKEADRAESAQATALVNFSIILVLLGLCLSLAGGYIVSTQLSKRIFHNIAHIENSTKDFQNITSELHQASDLLSSSSVGSASSLEQTVSSLEELASMVRLNADHAKEAAGLSNASSRAATEGDIETQKLISSMNEIKTSSKKIEEIINVIDDIAFQTNLLALNASVEAARAGEHGKGFAVVADAVRTLAQRSAVAAKDITSLIKDSVSKIENGTSLADRSGEVLKGIVSSVKKVADLNTEIATASQEQADGITTINKAMNEIDKATQTTAHLSEKVSKTSTDLGSHANNVNNEILGLKNMLSGGAAVKIELKKPDLSVRLASKEKSAGMFSKLFKSKSVQENKESKTETKKSQKPFFKLDSNKKAKPADVKESAKSESSPTQPQEQAKVIDMKAEKPKFTSKKTKAAEMIPFDEDMSSSSPDADPKRKVGTTDGF